jgi:acyl-CoA thioester hydrolase
MRITRKVYMQHTDCTGNAYHGIYFDWMLESRTELLEKWTGLALNNIDVGFVPININIDLKRPIKLGEEVVITVIAKVLSRTQVLTTYSCVKGDDVIFICDTTMVCLKDGKPTRIPEEIIRVLNE